MTRSASSTTSRPSPRRKTKRVRAAEVRTLLDEAKDLVYGDREDAHGNPSFCIDRVARLWSIYLSGQVGEDVVLSPHDVCALMVLLKIARTIAGSHAPERVRENWVDIAGYAEVFSRTQIM